MSVSSPRRWAVAVVAALLCVVTAGCGSSSSDEPAAGASGEGASVEEVVIGAPLPLSGLGAAFGIPYLSAMQLTVDRINDGGGIDCLDGAKLRLDAVDDASDSARGAQLLQQMAADGVSAFAGPLLSASVLASVPVISRLEIPFVGPNLDNAVTESGSPWIFRVVQPATGWGDQHFDWLEQTLEDQDAEVGKIGIVGIDVAPGTSTTDVLAARAEALGWEVVRINYDQKTTLDFAPIVAQLREENVDLITGYQNPNDAVLFAKAIAAQQWQPEYGFAWIAGGHYLTSFHEAVGDSADKWVTASYTRDVSESDSPELQELAADFAEREGQPLRGLAGAGPAIITVLASAIEAACSAEPAAIQEALRELEFDSAEDAPFPYYTMAGGVSFDDNGDNTAWTPITIQWQDDAQVAVAPEEVVSGDLIWPLRND